MENLLLAVNTVLPLFLLMATGYGVKQLKVYDDRALNVMNALVFRVFLPILIFKNIYTSRLEGGINWGVFAFAALSVVSIFGLLFLIIPRVEKDNRRRGVLVQGIARSNFVLFGIPLAQSLFNGADTAVTALLVAIIVPIFNILSVVALEAYRGSKIKLKSILKGIATNPLILASLLGIVGMSIRLQLPVFLGTAINDLAKIATPLALFLLGGSFRFSSVKGNLKTLLWAVPAKLLLSPLIFVSLAVLCGFRGIDLASLSVIFLAPSAVNSYTMAVLMGGDGELAGQMVVFTTAFSVVTIFLAVFLLKQFALL